MEPSAADLDLVSGRHTSYSALRGPPIMAAHVTAAASAATMALTPGRSAWRSSYLVVSRSA